MAYDNNVTGLVNEALLLLGEPKITSADNPESPTGSKLVDSYHRRRKELLRMAAWSFTETWAVLNYYMPAPSGFDYTDTYLLPNDYIRLIDIPGPTFSGATVPPQSVQEYRFITLNGFRVIALMNSTLPTLNVSYSADIKNLTLWDPLALKCLADWMALNVAKSVTGQDSLAERLEQQFALDLQDAVGVNGNEQRKAIQQYSTIDRERTTAFLGTPYWFTPVTGYN